VLRTVCRSEECERVCGVCEGDMRRTKEGSVLRTV
jgi:hypothetical protein